mgnify:FL=1
MKDIIKLLSVVGLFFTCSYSLLAQTPSSYRALCDLAELCPWGDPIYMEGIIDPSHPDQEWVLIYQVRKCSQDLEFKINAFRSSSVGTGTIKRSDLENLLGEALSKIMEKDHISAMLTYKGITLASGQSIGVNCYMSSCWRIPEYTSSTCYTIVYSHELGYDVDLGYPEEVLLPCFKPACCVYSANISKRIDCLGIEYIKQFRTANCVDYDHDRYDPDPYAGLYVGTGAGCEQGLCIDYFKDVRP